MKIPIRFVIVITKVKNQKAKAYGEEVRDWLKRRKIDCEVFSNDEFQGLDKYSTKPDLIIVFGGDGTVLSTVHKLNSHNLVIPILGFNLGRVGFLTTSEPNNWKDILNSVFLNKFETVSYMMLRYTLKRAKNEIEEGIVLNDIVISRYGIARLVEFRIWYDGIEIGNIRGDGLIVTTPLGSTAYAWAAGGALIDPTIRAFEVCPVCQFLTNIKPLVLPSNKPLKIKILSPLKELILTLDGQKGIFLGPEDEVEIREAKETVNFIQTRPVSYIERLKAKGYI